MLQLLETFLSGGYQICFATAAKPNAFSRQLPGIQYRSITLNDPSFNTFLQEIKPDIVLYDRFMSEEQFGWRVSLECPDALTILDTEDLHLLRDARQSAVIDQAPVNVYTPLSKREVASILRCDLSLMISQAEIKLLQETFKVPLELLWYIPFMEDPLDILKLERRKSYTSRKHFVFIGNYLHFPNVDAVEQLSKTIWPGIRQALPGVELHIYGAYITPRIQQLHKPASGFMIKGRAEDARTTLSDYRALLAPLRFGAGLKGKFIDAIHAGTPSLTTPVGAEGIGPGDQWAGEVCPDAQTMVGQAVRLYQDADAWEDARRRGLYLNNTFFNKSRHRDVFLKKVQDLQATLPMHRKQHFIGEIMRMDTINSKKYMSLWIQEKNKPKHTDEEGN